MAVASPNRGTWGRSVGMAVLLLVLLPGCTLVRNSFRTMVAEPLHYANNLDFFHSKRQGHRLAAEAWAQWVAASGPPRCRASDFQAGFEDGFVHYYLYGGTPQPPPLPPRRYWKVGRRDAAGMAAENAWFQGYACGARTAMETVGHSVVPSSQCGVVPGTLTVEGLPSMTPGEGLAEPPFPGSPFPSPSGELPALTLPPPEGDSLRVEVVPLPPPELGGIPGDVTTPGRVRKQP